MDVSLNLYFQININTCPVDTPFYIHSPFNDELNDGAYLTPEALHHKIENDGLNIGFVIGKYLRKMWDVATDWSENAYSLYTNMRVSHSINYEDFDYPLHQTINAESPIEGYEEHFKEGYPQAIVLHANYFRDSYFEKFLDQSILENSVRNQQFLNNLAKNHRVHNLVMFEVNDLCKIIEKAHQLGPIRFLMLSMHGEGQRMAVTSENNDYRKDNIDIYDFYYQNLGNQDLSCLELMDEGSLIILDSCDTANEVNLTIYNNTYTFPMSMQKLFALHAPQSKVFAPDFYAIKNSLVIKHTGNSAIQVYSQGEDSVNLVFGSFDHFKACLSLFNNPYLNEFMLLKPFKEVSAEKSDFCKEVLPYFSMKRFCDRAKLHPSEQKMKACIDERECHEATHVLSYIQEKTKNKCVK